MKLVDLEMAFSSDFRVLKTDKIQVQVVKSAKARLS